MLELDLGEHTNEERYTMKIKEYKCTRCQKDDFIALATKSNTVGIYCAFCGKFLKWASKDEKNLIKLKKQSKENV